MTEGPLTLESSAFLMLILLWIRASPLSIWAMIFSMSCSSLHRSQNTAAHKHNTSHHMLSGYGWAVRWWTASWHTRIFHDLLRGFALHLTGDVFDVVSSPLLIGLDELIEVTLGPDSKTLRIQDTLTWAATQTSFHVSRKSKHLKAQFSVINILGFSSGPSHEFPAEIYLREEVLLLLQLFFIKWFSFIDLGLLLFLHLGWVGQIGVSWHLLVQWHHAVENLVEIIASEEFLQHY